MKKITINQIILIGSVALIISIINILRVIVGAAVTPEGFSYLAVGHYYADYFVYVQQIVQGMRGGWLLENPLTTGDFTKTLLGWGQYLLYGKLANFFHLSPFLTYWVLVFVLSFLLSLLLFQLIKKLLPEQPFHLQIGAWLFSLLATPFIKIISENNQTKIVPFDFWYAPMSLFHRFGGVPHHLMMSILTVLTILIVAGMLTNVKEVNWWSLMIKSILVNLLMILLLTFSPLQVVSLISAIFLAGLFYARKKYFKILYFLILTALIILLAAILIKLSHSASALFQRNSAWDLGQQYHPSLWLILATVGPIILFIPFGVGRYFKSSTPAKLVFFLFVFFSWGYFFTTLAAYFGSHNLRFLNPVNYVLFGVLAILGMKTLVSRWPARNRILTGLILFFLGYFIVVTSVISASLKVDQLSYLPKKLISGIEILDKQPDKKTVLTSPDKSLGLIVPVLVERNVYLGRPIFTPDYENKALLADKFYRGQMSAEEGRQLLSNNNIGYVLLSSIENYPTTNLLKYPFLKEYYKNSQLTIFKYNP